MIPAITEVNFPSYATLHQATVSLQDMGDRVITTQVRIDGDIVPNFSGWELRFKGERFVLPSDNPQASKDNTTRNSIIDLQFQSWAIQELKRYYFFEAASVSAGVAIADKYIAPVRLNVEDFVALLNQVLQYYFGGKIVADLYLSGTGIYSQEPKVVDINYSYLWDVIGKIFEIYGVRNRIEYNASSDVYTIKINYPAPEISDHEFEYGYQGGLLKFERQVQDEDLSNILLGRGGEKNLPYRYFKKVDPQNPEWAADPDAIPELENIHFDRIRDINFRWYVRGWMHNPNRDTSGDEAWDPGHVFPTYEISSDSPYYWAYRKGLTDETFSPVEYVKDDDSIAAYGEHWGALEDNDDVFPTIQGRSRAGVGRIDEVVAVSPIVTDDIGAMAELASIEKSIDLMKVDVYANSRTSFEIMSDPFTVPTGYTGEIKYTPLSEETVFPNFVKFDTENTRLVAVPVNGGDEIPAVGIPAGTYQLKLYLAISIQSPAPAATGSFGIENIVLTTTAQDENAWKPTFDIWVKDIWNTQRQQGETDEQYSARVWEPILGDRTGGEAKVVFSTGFMSASEDYEFVVASYPVPDSSKSINGVPSAWRITLRKSDAEFDATGLYIPNATDGGKPVAGDKFFFVGVDMPHMYVVMSEEELYTVKSGELEGAAVVNPVWVVSLDKVRVNTLEAGEYGQTLADRLAAGAKLRVTDPRFSGGDVLTLYAQSVTYTWNEPTGDSPYVFPDIEVVLSDKVVSRESRQDKMESSVEEIRMQYARLDDVESVVRKVAEPLFLKKTGESDSSLSPTQFSSKVSSKGFRQGIVGGEGWGFYKDNTDEIAAGETGAGDSVLEVDRMVVRKDLQVNSLVVNQVEYRGGMEVISAAKIEISKVIETDTRYVCYFDQRKNSVANNFLVGDIAYGQVFTPQNATLRYYKCKVEAVDIDRVELSKTVKDGSGVPHAGDILVQYGSYTNAARQYVIVRDVIGGGYERMISGLNAVDAPGAEYYFAGRQSGNGPRWFVGGHGANDDYAEFVNGVLTIKANVVFKPGQQIPGLEDYEYLKTALPLDEDATLVSGGLILSKTIALTDAQGNIKAGINGLTTLGDIAAWYGGPMVDHEALPAAASYAKTIFRFDGSGYLAGGNINWDSDGYGGIPGITWRRENNQDVVTIGGNVRLASVSGDKVTDLLNTVRDLQVLFDWFEEVNLGTELAPLWALRLKKKVSGNDQLVRSFVTYGDQIVLGGTPGSGSGGGGVSWLAELMDVKKNLAPSVNDILVWRNNVSRNDGTTAPGWTNMTKSTFLSGYATQTWVTGQINDILSSVLKFQGTTTTAISDGSTTNPITIDGASYTAQKGDVVLYDGKEYLWQGSAWEQLGDESSWALKTTKIQAGTGLTGGGTLAANRTISLSSASIASLALADTAYQKPSSGIPKTDLASAVQTSLGHADDAYSYFTNGVANSAARLSGNTAYSVWGVEFWSNGVPKSVTARPNLYVGDTKVATSAQTAMNIGGIGNLAIANGRELRFLDNPDGGTARAINTLKITSENALVLGGGTLAKGYQTAIYGSPIRFYTDAAGGSGTTRMRIDTDGTIVPYADIIPYSNGNRSLGSASAMWKYTYTNRLYLTSSVYLEYVDNSGNGYVHINAPLVTDGDQIVTGGTPGGGSGGGKNYLHELLDVYGNPGDVKRGDGTARQGGDLLGYNSSLGLWVAVDKTTVGVTTAGTVNELNAANPLTALRVWSPSVLASWLAGKNFLTSAVTNVAVGGSGHTDELAITKDGSTSYLTVPYATNVERFKRYAGTDETGGYDLNTLLSGGGITSQYTSSSYWGNRPDSMSYGGVLQLNPYVSNTLAMQLAWDIDHTNVKTGKLWWRDSIYKNSTHTWGEWHLIYDDTTLTKAVVAGLLDDGNGTYVKLNPGRAEQTISSNISSLEKGVVNLWRKSGDHSTFLGFSNGTTETYLGGIGFKSQSDHNLYRKDGSNYYKIWDASNANLSTVDWAAKDLSAAGALSVTGAASVNKLTIASTAGEAHIAFGRGGYNYITTPASGVLNIVTGGRSLSLANSTAVFTNTDVRPGANATYSLGTGTYCWEGIYGRYLELKKNGGASLVFRGTTTLNNQTHTILFKGGTDDDSNGFKIETVPTTSYGRQGLGFYTSNVASGSAPYTPDWKRSLYISHGGTVYVGATDHANQLVVYGTATIGTATAATGATLTVNGVIASSGDQVVTSDIRVKRNIKPIELTVEQIASCRAVTFDWASGGHSFGSIAQDWEPILPEAVKDGDIKALAYGQLGAVMGIKVSQRLLIDEDEILKLQKHETAQDKEIRVLKDALGKANGRIEALEKEVKQLRAN